MTNIAIKGHITRGEEVIQLLEMLGGKNLEHFNGSDIDAIYYISSEGYINVLYDKYTISNYNCFTLEEFLEKYPYKVEDKVRTIYGRTGIINALIWSKRDNCIKYELEADCDSLYYTNELLLYKEEKTFPSYMDYDIKATKEQETMEEPKELLIGFTKDNEGNWILNTHKDYEIEEVNGKFKLVKKKPVYPKTYKECCDVLGYKNRNNTIQDFLNSCDLYDFELMTRLSMLKLCRDAYWKIAGEEMGLDKPWVPDWTNIEIPKHCILVDLGEIECEEVYRVKCILAFPTKEMRDIFYENFKDLIEECKELL